MTKPMVDLDTCAREPIHIPGAIQPHGVLFVLTEPELTIVQVSENTDKFLGIPAEELLGKGLESFLNAEQVKRIRFALNSANPTEHNPVQLQLRSKDESTDLDGMVHLHDGFAILELEPSTAADNTYFLGFYKAVSRTINRLQSAPTLHTLVDQAAAGIQEIAGFDRVMIYRLADSGDGQVIAEAKTEALGTYLGLWYPASDIPAQARRLYILNLLRCIPQVIYTPVQIIPAINKVSKRPVDLSYASLRSASQIYCEYLTNMGVSATMVISLLTRDGELWGLIACHHHSTKIVPYETRKSCTFLGQVLSGEIVRREAEEDSAYNSKSTAIQAKFLELMAGSADPLLGLVNSTPNLLDLIPAAGAAVVMQDRVQTIGVTPGYTDLMTIVDLLRASGTAGTFATRSLKNHFAAAGSMTATASGIIALNISQNPDRLVLYFRPEVAETVVWAGDPNKAVSDSEDGFRISPRKSFAAWQENSQGTALLWTRNELRVADELRKLITVVSFKKSEAKLVHL